MKAIVFKTVLDSIKEKEAMEEMPMVTLVNCFEAPEGREDEFFRLWQEVNIYMRAKQGYLGHKLHRALSPDTNFRFINVAQWASVADFNAAHDEGFRALVTHPAFAPFRSFPALYEVVHEGQTESASAAA